MAKPLSRTAGTTGSLPPVPRQAFQSDYFTVIVDERPNFLRMIRSSKPFSSIEEVEATVNELSLVLDWLGRSRYAALLDMRAALGRNDPAFEDAVRRMSTRWMGGFRKAGVLVQSVIGAMQVNRYAKHGGVAMLVSHDEASLLRYLTEEA